MKEDKFKRIIYDYYPKNISPYNREDYLKSIEFKKLKAKIKSKQVFTEKNKNLLLDKLNSLTGLNFKDFSLFSWNDRAYNIQSIIKKEDSIIKVFCINISIILPYFTTYVINIERKRNGLILKYETSIDVKSHKDYEELTQSIEKKLVESFYLNKFPNQIRDKIIEGIGFQDIEIGEFTFFNALFLDSYKHSRF